MNTPFSHTPFGLFQNSGSDGSDGSDGSSAAAVSGISGFSGRRTSPLLTSALRSTSDDLRLGYGQIAASRPAAPVLNHEQALPRWSRDVRGHLYEFELMSGLGFDTSDAARPRLMAGTTVIAEVPQAKYIAEGSPALQDALQEVVDLGALRAERTNEILTQVTLPYSFFAMVLNLQPGRHRHTFELMAAVFRFSTMIVMQFKQHFKARRPADYSALVHPILATPGHGSYPAGHATQCAFVAEVLKALVGGALGTDAEEQLDALAARIAENRVVAGLHFVEDNTAGAALGRALAQHFLRKAGQEPSRTALGWLWDQARREWN